jgi:metal-responsive CopG/Arc/MetJ family transcriptional regulator
MSQLSRTGVSLEESLLKEFDRLSTKRDIRIDPRRFAI